MAATDAGTITEMVDRPFASPELHRAHRAMCRTNEASLHTLNAMTTEHMYGTLLPGVKAGITLVARKPDSYLAQRLASRPLHV